MPQLRKALCAICLGLAAQGLGVTKPCTDEKIFARSVADECGPLDRFGPTLDWTGVIGEIFEARNAGFWEGPSAAQDQLVNLLALVGQSFELASQCPAAVATASYSLAEVLAAGSLDNKTQGLQQLALIQFGLAMLPTRAHRECTQWPLRGRDLVAAFQQLGTRFSTRAEAAPAGQESLVAVVTACAGLHLPGVRSSSKANRQLYAARHGYDLHFFQDANGITAAFGEANLTHANAPAYWRAYALRSVMALSRPHSWLLWIDCDVLVTDLDMPATQLLTKHGGTFLDASASVSMLASANGLGVHPEILLLRKGAWGQDFLRNWTRLPSPGFLHPSLRIPSDERHPERVALQHAILPHWGVWVQGHAGRANIAWKSFGWRPEVSLAFSLVARADGTDVPPTMAVAGTGLWERRWTHGDFAWADDECRGREGLRAAKEAFCLERRAQVLALLAKENDRAKCGRGAVHARMSFAATHMGHVVKPTAVDLPDPSFLIAF